LTSISGSVPPFKFDSNGNVLANINAQNITPIVNVPNIKTDSNGNVLANINAQNIYPVTYGYDLVVSGGSLTLTSSAGFNSIYIDSGVTLTIPSGVTVIVETLISGFGDLVVDGTLIVFGNVSINGSISISGSGTINILVGNTLSINGNVEISSVFITGLGILSVPSGYTLTQTGNISLAIQTIEVAGTWVNAGYGITIPHGAAVTWITTGSITTTSPAGTITVNGVLFYHGNGLTPQTSNALPTFILNITGTGLFMGSPSTSAGTATAKITFSSTSIAPNSEDGSATASGNIAYYVFTSISGSATGQYGLGYYASNTGAYYIFVLIYIGTANTAFNWSITMVGNQDVASATTYAYSANGSAGTITLTGALYV